VGAITDDLLFADATDQLAALGAGQIGAVELLTAALARVERLNPRINAVVTRDVERAMGEARAVDAARSRGAALGPLAGLPMTVKDNFDIEGLPASLGLKANLGRTVQDAYAVARVRAAGAIVWGQTNVPAGSADHQTYNALYGVTRNPWDLARTPGGSSGGSAAALAAGFTALEIGADVGGSIRVPASFCGVAGHRPSWGLIPQRGMPAPPGYMADYDLMVVGPMARSVRDVQLLMGVLADIPVAPAPALRDLKVGLWLDEPSFPLDAPVRAVIADFAGRLAREGAAVETVASPLPAREMLTAYMTLLAAILGAGQPPAALAIFDLFRGPAKLAMALGAGPLSWAHGILGETARHHEWLAANEARARMKADLAPVFERCDVILSPVAPVPAFPHNHAGPQIARRLTMSDGRRIEYLELVDWIALATLCDLPATVIPAGLTPEGLPVGVQIIGPPGADAATLAAASALEAAAGGFHAPPAL
jgi:amidase